MDLRREQEEASRLRGEGLSQTEIAERMGLSRHAVQRRLRAWDKWQDADPAAQHAATVAGSGAIPHSFWLKTDTHSVYYQTPKDNTVTDLVGEVKSALADLPQYQPMKTAARGNDILAVYPLMDAHFGMLAWGDETGGQDYDLKHASTDLKQSFTNLCADMPDADTAILVLGGDTLHADDNEGHTQSRNHVVDTDGRLYKSSEVAIDAIAWVIDLLCSKHAKLIIRVLRGNHDEHSHLILHFALAARYRDADNVDVVDAKMDHYWYRHGSSLIAFHHGDKRPAKELAMFLADTCPEWSATKDRHLMTGHIHHDSVKEFTGVKWWSLRAFCPTDKYGHMFGSRRALQGFKFSEKFGWKGNEVEPILRGGE